MHQIGDVETRTSTKFDALTLLTEIVTSGKTYQESMYGVPLRLGTQSCLGSHGVSN